MIKFLVRHLRDVRLIIYHTNLAKTSDTQMIEIFERRKV